MLMEKEKLAWLTSAAIWCLPITLLIIGAVYAFGDDWRTANQAYDVPKLLLPIQVWGAMFIVVGLLELVSHIRNDHYWMVLSKCVGAGVCLVWALMLSGSLILHWGDAPIVFPILFVAIAFYHLGVVAYLVRTE